MRVFLDTNVLVSALTTRGLCAELVARIVKRKLELVTGDVVVGEFRRILFDKFHINLDELAYAPEFLSRLSIVSAQDKIPVAGLKIPDPDDIPIVACAIGASTEYFITGDKALLELEHIEDMTIVSPRRMWEILSEME